MNKITIADIMTRDPVVISPNADLMECAKIMVKKKVGSILIVYEKRLVGIITEKDILWAIVKKSCRDLENVKAIDISPKKIATIKPTATAKEAFEKMKKLKFERLPVIQDGKLVGMVTIKDILNFNPEIYPELEELAEIREETEKLQRIKLSKGKKPTSEGVCGECGNFGTLYRNNGMLICESCLNS